MGPQYITLTWKSQDRLLDTPGVEDMGSKDTEHVPRIIDGMAKIQLFNLIAVIVNCKDTLSKSHQLAFDYYSNI
ncbi:hypothetical protein CPC16_003907, partial [Podila verticillata]